MAASSKLVGLLRANLDKVQVPANYDELRSKLMALNPGREAPAIKESPENARRLGSIEHD